MKPNQNPSGKECFDSRYPAHKKMWKDKSPGVKILWVWTIGTAAVLVASVATTRIRDMNKVLNAQSETPQSKNSILTDNLPDSTEFIREDNA